MSATPFELAIVGGGATGLAAAIQAASDGLRVVLLERDALGGRIRDRARVEVVPGLPVGPSGLQLAEQAVATASRLGAELRCASPVEELGIRGTLKHLRVADGSAVSARSLIVATGTEYPALPIRGLRDFTGRGIHFGVPPVLPEILRDGELFVTGEPTVAAVAAVELSDRCRSVTLLSTGRGGSPRVDAALRDQLHARPDVIERRHWEIAEAVGVERLEALILRDGRSGRTVVRNAAALFILGVDRPRTGWLRGALALDSRGYVLTGTAASGDRVAAGCCSPRQPWLESSRSGVFAAGGARGTRDCCVESVGGEGASAARQALHYLRRLGSADPASAGRP